MDKTLAKGLSILELLVGEDCALGVTEIGRRLDLSKSNAHRLLQTLAALGYVSSLDGRYAVTPKLGILGCALMERLDVRRVAMPELERLAGLTRETVHLSILDDGHAIYIEKIDSPQPVRAYSRIGGRAPAWCVATGKAMLAFAEPRVLAGLPDTLPQSTPWSLPDRAALLEELAGIRARGYAMNRGEWREDVAGIGAPIRGGRGQVIAALGISGPVSRLTPAVMERFAPAVVASAAAVSRQLGASASPASGEAPGGVTSCRSG
jgi:IclR family transcriptional regulator, KDG regulon repressor